jgi:anti-sigma regulatory factor (Ser/Thr protein kinase)
VSALETRHALFVYDDDDAFAETVSGFLLDGLEAREGVYAVLDSRRTALLEDALGAVSERVVYLDRDTYYTRPEAALAGYDRIVREALSDGQPSLRVIAELPPSTSPDEWDRWMSYEAVVNRALAGRPLWIVCGYDRRELPPEVVWEAYRSHPEVYGTASANARYTEPEEVLRTLARTAAVLPALQRLAVRDARDLRRQLAAALAAANVDAERAQDLGIAAGEVLAEAHRHGYHAPTLRVGLVEGRFACELGDVGPVFDDPLAGWLPPRSGVDAGASLWIARQLSSQLEVLRAGAVVSVRLWV